MFPTGLVLKVEWAYTGSVDAAETQREGHPALDEKVNMTKSVLWLTVLVWWTLTLSGAVAQGTANLTKCSDLLVLG